MAAMGNVGQTATMTLVGLDQYGNPIAFTPDSPPTWTDTTPSDATLAVASNGLSATDKFIGAGSDTVSVNVIVGGVVFPASIAFAINQAPPVLTTMTIQATIA